MKTETVNIVMIGAGNVAVHLSRALSDAGMRVIQVYSRSELSAKNLADMLHTDCTASLAEILPTGDLYIVAVNDDAIAEVVAGLPLREQMVVHTAGSVPMDVFAEKLLNYGVLYPLQTFSREYAPDFIHIPLFAEASSPENMQLLRKVAGKISSHVYELSSDKRMLLHLAAVFGSNFVHRMYVIAAQILHEAGLDFGVLSPLIVETARKAVSSSDPARLQTGPARRNDRRVLQQHMERLSAHPEWQRLYAQLSDSIGKHYHHE
ncbi:MAG: DUF2520 domain-containing protein [Bacteroidales bacterium]|jgi:predicted short-subunit dehydrogenase-like oxidoreductase (DUF2520 family)|nr:DUF2520 domain-containing protein [Bacteroidales bacterium]